MQVVLGYLEWFRRNSVLKCVLQPIIAKNSLKTPILGVRVVQGHRCWYHWKARRQCYHMVKTRSLYVTRLFLHRAVTDGRTDRIAIANTRLSSTCQYSCGA